MALSPQTAVHQEPISGFNVLTKENIYERTPSSLFGSLIQVCKLYTNILQFTFCSHKKYLDTDCRVHVVQYWWDLVQSYSCCSCGFKGIRGCHHTLFQTMESGHLNKRCRCVRPQRDMQHIHTISGILLTCSTLCRELWKHLMYLFFHAYYAITVCSVLFVFTAKLFEMSITCVPRCHVAYKTFYTLQNLIQTIWWPPESQTLSEPSDDLVFVKSLIKEIIFFQEQQTYNATQYSGYN